MGMESKVRKNFFFLFSSPIFCRPNLFHIITIFSCCIFSSFKTDNCLYMLMEYEPLSSVDQYIEEGVGIRPGGINAARFYTACAMIAIEYMHKVMTPRRIHRHHCCQLISQLAPPLLY